MFFFLFLLFSLALEQNYTTSSFKKTYIASFRSQVSYKLRYLSTVVQIPFYVNFYPCTMLNLSKHNKITATILDKVTRFDPSFGITLYVTKESPPTSRQMVSSKDGSLRVESLHDSSRQS